MGVFLHRQGQTSHRTVFPRYPHKSASLSSSPLLSSVLIVFLVIVVYVMNQKARLLAGLGMAFPVADHALPNLLKTDRTRLRVVKHPNIHCVHSSQEHFDIWIYAIRPGGHTVTTIYARECAL